MDWVTVKPGTAGPTCGPVGAGLLLGLVEGVDLGRPLAGLHVLVAHGAVPRVTCPGVTAATLTLPPAPPAAGEGESRGSGGGRDNLACGQQLTTAASTRLFIWSAAIVNTSDITITRKMS